MEERRKDYPQIIEYIKKNGNDVVCLKEYFEAKFVALDKALTLAHDNMKPIWTTVIGIIFSLIVQLVVFAALWGKLVQTVDTNSARISAVENLHPRINVK